MRDYVIYDMYTDDRMFRYEVYKHPNGMYEVCVQSREAEDFAVNEQYLYCDIPEEVTHFTHEIAHGSMRLSFSDDNTEEDIDYILEIVPEIVSYLRSMSPLWEKIKKQEAQG